MHLAHDSHASSMPVRVHLLGGFRVAIDGDEIPEADWRLRKSRQLIKILALQPDYSLHREQLIEMLWPELDPEAGANNLHKALHFARRTLNRNSESVGHYLQLQQDVVALRSPGHLWTDLKAFEEAAAAAKHDRDISAYIKAADLYTGDLLPEDRYEDWASSRREELCDLYLSILMELAVLQQSSGDLTAAAETLQRVVAREPAHEAAHVELMSLHARSGHRHQALRQFHRLSEALKREMEAEPGPEARQAYQAVLSGQLAQASAAPERAASEARPVASPLFTTLPRLAGRGEELDRLEEMLDCPFEGKGALVLLSGEAGVGKTRLALEAAQRAARRGAQVLSGAAYEQESQLPYGPFVEALRGVEEQALPPQLQSLLGEGHSDVADASIQGLEDRQRLFLAVANFISALTAAGPVALVIDDLHAADEASLELLHFLARTKHDAPLLIVGTLRRENPEQALRLSSFLSSIQRERLAVRIDLDPLGPGESESLVASLLNSAPIDQEVFDAVYNFAEGNPFYTEEYVRSLQESGALSLVGGRWLLRGEDSPVPVALAEIVSHRLRRLREATRRVLNLMAVVGRDVSYPLLRTAADVPEGDLLDALDDALSHHVIEESAQGYRFSHPIHRAVLHQQVNRARRMSLHSRVAKAFEGAHEERRDEVASDLAYHYALSEDPLQATPHLRTAARHAASVFANEQAVRMYEQAVEILETADAKAHAIEIASLLEEAADVLNRSGDTDRSEELYTRSMRLLAEQKDEAGAGRLRTKAALSAMTGGNVEQAGELLKTTLEAMNDEWPQLIVARTYYALAQLRWHSAQHSEALEAAEMALRAAQSSEDAKTKANAYEVMALACHSLGDWQKGIEYELQRSALDVRGFDSDEVFDTHF